MLEHIFGKLLWWSTNIGYVMSRYISMCVACSVFSKQRRHAVDSLGKSPIGWRCWWLNCHCACDNFHSTRLADWVLEFVFRFSLDHSGSDARAAHMQQWEGTYVMWWWLLICRLMRMRCAYFTHENRLIQFTYDITATDVWEPALFESHRCASVGTYLGGRIANSFRSQCIRRPLELDRARCVCARRITKGGNACTLSRICVCSVYIHELYWYTYKYTQDILCATD